MAKPSIGVIVGRFQVHELHEGHLDLFRQVSSLHERVIVFIGTAPTGVTKRNPLDFETRKKMIQAEYPDFTFIALMDCPSDDIWSANLDDKIHEVAMWANVTLYGGRDSFLPHYTGRHTPRELVIKQSISGEQVRASLTNRVMQSAEFRAGQIYVLNNMFPRVISTVDIAIVYYEENGDTRLCLGRKANELGWRFIGGHAVPGKTFEQQARTETLEETGLDLVKLTPIGSVVIHDWRWIKEEGAGVVTSFYLGQSMTKGGKAADDIEEISWHNWNSVQDTIFEEAHKPLFYKLQNYFEDEKRKENARVTPQPVDAD